MRRITPGLMACLSLVGVLMREVLVLMMSTMARRMGIMVMSQLTKDNIRVSRLLVITMLLMLMRVTFLRKNPTNESSLMCTALSTI